MASKSFTLADTPDGSGSKGPCSKLCICSCAVIFIGILGAVGVYVYQISNVCSVPELDENGLSNWTSRTGDHIAYACFPGYFVDGGSNLVVSKCEEGMWKPPPPACNSLPLRIDCHVNNQSLVGNITMWQHSVDTPTHIYGRINYGLAVKPQGHLMEHVMISKQTCNVSHVTPLDPSEIHPHPEPKAKSNKTEENSEHEDSSSSEEEDHKEDEQSGEKILHIKFNSTQLKAFRKTELFMNIIFVDQKTTATLVSVHQENLTLVMTGTDPLNSLNSSWSWDKEKTARKLVF